MLEFFLAHRFPLMITVDLRRRRRMLLDFTPKPLRQIKSFRFAADSARYYAEHLLHLLLQLS
jgi:hypothetical protein